MLQKSFFRYKKCKKSEKGVTKKKCGTKLESNIGMLGKVQKLNFLSIEPHEMQH